MQNRMKTHQLTSEQIDKLLETEGVCSLATVGRDNKPYVTPMHFVYMGGSVYMHGLPKGQKIDNIIANPDVSMTVYRMDGYVYDDNGRPCNTNTKYESVILSGKAYILGDGEEKLNALNAIVTKFSPALSGAPISAARISGTAVIKIEITAITGKYY